MMTAASWDAEILRERERYKVCKRKRERERERESATRKTRNDLREMNRQ